MCRYYHVFWGVRNSKERVEKKDARDPERQNHPLYLFWRTIVSSMRMKARSCGEVDLPCGWCGSLPEELGSEISGKLESHSRIRGENRQGLTNIWFKVKRHGSGGSQPESGRDEREKGSTAGSEQEGIHFNGTKNGAMVHWWYQVVNTMVLSLQRLFGYLNTTYYILLFGFAKVHLFCWHHQGQLFLDPSPSISCHIETLFTIQSIPGGWSPS